MYVEEREQATVLLKPLRVEILQRLAEPRSCPELAASLGPSTQKIYYHVKALEAAGLIERVSERRVRGIVEGIYQAKARSYWLSAALVGRIGGPRSARDELSLGYLLTLAEELQADVARLAEETGEVPSLGLSATIDLEPGQRAEFLRELRASFEQLLTRYGGAGNGAEPFRIALACYPSQGEN